MQERIQLMRKSHWHLLVANAALAFELGQKDAFAAASKLPSPAENVLTQGFCRTFGLVFA